MSKWANRLKGVLTKTEISEQCLDSALTITDKTPQKIVSSVIVSGQSRHCLKNSDFVTEKNRVGKIEQCLNSALTKADKTQKITFQKTETEIKFQKVEVDNSTLTTRLNAMIAAGVSFEVAADDFQSFGASERETAFLQANKTAVLCTLQQGFLQKELFRHSPDLLEVFTVEVHERSAMMSDGEPGTSFQAVCQVTKDWIAEATAKL